LEIGYRQGSSTLSKIKVPIPINSGINTQATPTQRALTKLRNARNAYYKRDDMTLRRRADITDVGAGVLDPAFFTPRNCTFFADTDKTFRKFVYSVDATAGGFTTGTLAATNVESPGAFDPIGLNQMGTGGYLGIRRPTQYNNILYWPSLPNSAGLVGAPVAWNGITSDVREAGIDVQQHGVATTTYTINVAGAGALTFVTGRRYAYTLYDSVNDVKSMPANDGVTLRTVTTGVIAGKVPVVTITWGAIDPNLANVNNNHDSVRFYATTDGGVTFYFHSQVTITPDANTVGATAVLTDSMPDSTLVAGEVLDYLSPPPPAKFFAKFENKLVAGGTTTANASLGNVTGEGVVGNVLYYSLTDQPEMWPRNLVFRSDFNAIPFKDQDGDELQGAIQVNRVLLVGLQNSVWTINHLPIVGVDPLFDFSTLKDRISDTHGFISAYAYENLKLSDDEDAAFYVSQRGFHLNNGSVDKLVSNDIQWDDTIYNSSQSSLVHVINDTSNFIIIIGFPSVDSDVVDSAYVYHYHPSHLGEDGVGVVTGPWDYPLACSTLVLRADNTREVWGITNSTTVDNIIVKIKGTTGYDYSGSAIPFEWETGWVKMADDAAARLREINFTIEEADSNSIALGVSTISQVIPKVTPLQFNTNGAALKVLWDDDNITVRQITGGGVEVQQGPRTLTITSTDRAVVSVTADAEVYGEDKNLADGSMIES